MYFILYTLLNVLVGWLAARIQNFISCHPSGDGEVEVQGCSSALDDFASSKVDT